ncbi:MAG: acyl carrier protein [Nitrospira sp.]|jgi:acyl carrier protein|nr:phosphopantetheine-binding protein [Nitrospira sp. BO4]
MSKPLTPDEIRQTVLRLLSEIAPEADLSVVKPDISLRDQLDIDSMDFLNFVIMIHKTFGVEIAEADYPKYGTLNGCVEQLSGKHV